jgi:hypothetical protein
MKKLFFLIFMFITCEICKGQNLVPNGSFEQFVGCPSNWAQFDSCLIWVNPTGATPDYFNQCSIVDAGVPNNFAGFQNAHGGVAYAGLMQRELNSAWHEYIEIQLSAPLVSGFCYSFEMFVSTAEHCQYKTSAIGVYFSDSLYNNFQTSAILPLVPQINNTPGNVPSNINWMQVSGTYLATGGENYLIIGNFKDSANSPLIVSNPNATNDYDYAYVYIDDVSLTLSSCTALEEPYEKDDISIYPNPFNDKINITTESNKMIELSLFDITAIKILTQSFTKSATINTEQLPKGIYFYELSNKNSVIKKGKIVKN